MIDTLAQESTKKSRLDIKVITISKSPRVLENVIPYTQRNLFLVLLIHLYNVYLISFHHHLEFQNKLITQCEFYYMKYKTFISIPMLEVVEGKLPLTIL